MQLRWIMKPYAIFIDNHIKEIAAVDFFTVSTVAFRILYTASVDFWP